MTPPTRWTPCWNGQNATGSTRAAQHRAVGRTDRRAARRFRMAAPALAAGWFALVLALGVVSLPLAGTARQMSAVDVLNDVMVALLTVVLAGVGLVVAGLSPRNKGRGAQDTA